MTDLPLIEIAKQASEQIEEELLRTRFNGDFIDNMVEFIDKAVLSAVLKAVDYSQERQSRSDYEEGREMTESYKEQFLKIKAENAKLRAALENIRGSDFQISLNSEVFPGTIAEQALSSSTSGKDLLDAIRGALEAMGRIEWRNTDIEGSRDIAREALSALRKALGEEK